MFNLEVGKPLPQHPDYLADKQKRAFWRDSYKCDKDYIRKLDASGRHILVQHRDERKDDYIERLDRTVPRNHAGNIIRKYNSYVFRQQITRTDTSELAQQIYNDVDMRGTDIDTFMRQATLDSAVDGISYLLADTTNASDGRIITIAQKRAAGIRPFIRKINPDWVYNWTCNEGFLLEVLITFTDQDGNPFARWYDDMSFVDIGLKLVESTGVKKVVITSVSAPKPHGYPQIPVVQLKPHFDTESQISNLAELQKAITNNLSLLDTEMVNKTFTTYVVTGVDLSNDEMDKQHAPTMTMGSKTIIYLKESNAKLQAVGSDVNQAESIRTTIREIELALYRTAGLRSPDPLRTGPAESGIAKEFNQDDLSVNLKTIADAAEVAENTIMNLIFAGEGKGQCDPAHYPNKFDLPDFMTDLQETPATLMLSGLPDVIKKKQLEQFTYGNFDLSADEQAEFEAAMETWTSPPQPALPQITSQLSQAQEQQGQSPGLGEPGSAYPDPKGELITPAYNPNDTNSQQ